VLACALVARVGVIGLFVVPPLARACSARRLLLRLVLLWRLRLSRGLSPVCALWPLSLAALSSALWPPRVRPPSARPLPLRAVSAVPVPVRGRLSPWLLGLASAWSCSCVVRPRRFPPGGLVARGRLVLGCGLVAGCGPLPRSPCPVFPAVSPPLGLCAFSCFAALSPLACCFFCCVFSCFVGVVFAPRFFRKTGQKSRK